MTNKNQFLDLEDERFGLFMSNNSFDLDIALGRNFLETDNPQEVLIYRINLLESKTHSLYNQAKPKDKKYMSPVKIKCIVNIESSKQEYYANNPGGITRDDTGPISINIYLKELEEKNIEINRGDIIEYNLSGEKNRYYEVDNANVVSDTTDKTIGGFKNFYKKITGIPVKSDVVNLIES
jgi:hypothetical protein